MPLKILCVLTARECSGGCPEKRIERGTDRKCPAEYLPEPKKRPYNKRDRGET